MRGSPCDNSIPHIICGIIPAHAGITKRSSGGRTSTSDHPRACGDHHGVDALSALSAGSSPRMRGSRVWCSQGYSLQRIIPAHAGITCCIGICCGGTRDHPRACGDHHCTFALRFCSAGSSPRMRGSRQNLRLRGNQLRIIPAHAGITFALSVNTLTS